MSELELRLNPSDVEHLEQIAELSNTDENTAVRQAIATEAFIRRQLAAGSRFLIEAEDGRLRHVAFPA